MVLLRPAGRRRLLQCWSYGLQEGVCQERVLVPCSLCGAACRATGAGPFSEPAGTPRPENSKLPNKLSSTQSQVAVLASFGGAVPLHA